MTGERHKPSPPTSLRREEFAEEMARLIASKMPQPPPHPCIFDKEVGELLVELAREYKETKKTRKLVRGIVLSVVVTGLVTAAGTLLWEGLKSVIHK